MITCHVPANSTFGFFASIVRPGAAGVLVDEQRRASTSCRRRSCDRRRAPAADRSRGRARRRRRCSGFVGCTMMRPMRPVSGSPMFCPRRARVGGLVDAVADEIGVANRPRFAGAGPHDRRFRRRDGERADRLHRHAVEDGRNVAPLSTDFQTPPDAAPRYHTRASPGTPVIDANPPALGGSHHLKAEWIRRRRRGRPLSGSLARRWGAAACLRSEGCGRRKDAECRQTMGCRADESPCTSHSRDLQWDWARQGKAEVWDGTSYATTR